MGQMKGKDKKLDSAFAWDWFPEHKGKLMVTIRIDDDAVPVTEFLSGLIPTERTKLAEVLSGAAEALNEEDEDKWITTPGGAKLRTDIELDDLDELSDAFVSARDAVDGSAESDDDDDDGVRYTDDGRVIIDGWERLGEHFYDKMNGVAFWMEQATGKVEQRFIFRMDGPDA